MFTEKISKTNITDFAVEQIEKVIFAENLQPGDRLPSLGELQVLLGISQGAIREAVRILREKGLIDVKRGRSGGIFVKAVCMSNISNSLSLMLRQQQISPESLLVFRYNLEVTATSLAVAKAKKEDINDLIDLLSLAEEQLQYKVEGWDKFFHYEDLMHKQLIKMTDNPLYDAVLTTIYRQQKYYNQELVPKQFANMTAAFDDWTAIKSAMESGLAEKSSLIMRSHLKRFLPENEGKFLI